MAKLNLSSKRLQIDKANTTVVLAVSVTTFVTVFSLFSSQALLSQRSYQNRVIKEKQTAKNQLDKNVQAVNSLAASYQSFVDRPTNLIGGSSKAEGAKGGDNARLILDALPSQYDYPALATSIEKILTDNNFKVNGISGKDDELSYNQPEGTGGSEAVEMPYGIGVEGTYTSVRNLFTIFERSIRPFETREIGFTGTDSSLKVTISGVSYYQPAKKLDITTKEVK